MSERDLDSLYKSASERDSARPSTAVRQAILEHARRLADEPGRIERTAPSRWSRWFARWPQLRWQIGLPLAAAALAVILWQPLLRSTLPAPAVQKSALTRLQESAPPASAASHSAAAPPADLLINMPVRPSEPVPAAPQVAQRAPSVAPAAPYAMTSPAPAARAAVAPPANLASNADVAVSQSAVPAARRQASPPAAPLGELRELAPAASAPAGLSPGDPLHEAAAQGNVVRLRALLQQSAAPIDARDARGRTALMLAVLHGHEAAARALLEQGADPNIGDFVGRTPLAVAREQHQLPVVAALLQAGAR